MHEMTKKVVHETVFVACSFPPSFQGAESEISDRFCLQGSASAIKGDFLLSSEHLIEIITKLHRTGATAADSQQLNVDISDE